MDDGTSNVVDLWAFPHSASANARQRGAGRMRDGGGGVADDARGVEVTVAFSVYGRAEPAGSKRGFVRGKRAVIVDANPNAKTWQSKVIDAALEAYDGPLLDEPLVFTLMEYRVRPKGHFKKNGEL